MRRFFTALAIVLMVAGLAVGLGAFVFADSGNKTDNPFSVDVRPGEIFRIRLESNPSTGYGWQVDFDEAYVEFLRSYMEEFDPTRIGSGVTEVFVFRGLVIGNTEITFSYKRPWEAGVLKTVTYEAKVNGKAVDWTDGFSQEESERLARDFITNSPTFVFDGMPGTLELVKVEEFFCTGCYEFTFTFDSRHGGYGDRTGQMVTEAITPHTARVVVEGDEVTSSMMDDVWAMMSQSMVTNSDNSISVTSR